jgi:hypothetical protein
MRVLAFLFVVLGPLAGRVIGAQQAPTGTATAVGTVFDSIRLRPLAGARVRVDTTGLFTTADADGRFRLEGIPIGPHVLRVEHAMLDPLGIALRSPGELYGAGTSVTAEMATPAPETLIQYVCTPAWRARGPAALMGKVREADTGTPATGAKVSLVWYEIDITAGVRRAPRVREVNVGPDGTYRFCGLPAQLSGKLQVLRGPLTSGDITVEFGENLLFLRSLTIAAPGAVVAVAGADSGRAPAQVLGSARLTGKVLNNVGRPLSGARVQLDGTLRVATTRESGDFILDSLPPGTQTVTVRLLGFAPTEQAVDLASREARNVTIRLTDFVPVLEAVRVSATRERALDAIGFARRKRTGTGHYMEGDAINNNALYFSDVVRMAPGVRVMPYGQRNVIVNSRDPNGCVNIWVDGNQWQSMEPGDIDDYVKPYEIGAIEVYSSSQAPAEFQGGRGASCSTLVVWTFRRLDRKR